MMGLQNEQENSRRILLLRHFSAQSGHFGVCDKDIPLAGSSVSEINWIKEHCASILEEIDFVICSNARRTRQSLDSLLIYLPSKITIHFDDQLYHGSHEYILDQIKYTDNEYKNIMVIAHNPGLGCFLQEVQLKNQIIRHAQSFPTGGLAVLEFNEDSWIKADFKKLGMIDFFKHDH